MAIRMRVAKAANRKKRKEETKRDDDDSVVVARLEAMPKSTFEHVPTSAIVSRIASATMNQQAGKTKVCRQKSRKLNDHAVRGPSGNKLVDTGNMAFLLPIGSITNIYEKVYDCCCFLIHCINHNRVCVLKSPSSPFIWLPFVAIPTKCCWTKTAKDSIALILSNDSTSRYEYLKRNPPYNCMQLIEILRLQIPQTRRFITRLAFYVRMHMVQLENKFVCCTSSERLDWLEMNYVVEGVVENIWGPELVEFCRVAQKPCTSGGEFILPQRITEFGQSQVFQYNPRSETPRNLEESLLKSVKITENDIERLYYDFLEHCYPSFYMTFDSFRQYLYRNGVDTNYFSPKRLFNAFNYMMNGYLSFHEVLLGLVAMDQETQHDEVRIKFVFRYYDIKKQGTLYEEDMRRLLKDMYQERDGKTVPSTDQEIVQKAREAMNTFQARMVRGRKVITYRRFLATIASHQFRGTSVLCRSKKSIFVYIAKRMTAQNISHTKSNQQFILSNVVNKKYYPERCKGCKAKKYKLVPFLLFINMEAYYENSSPIRVTDRYANKWDQQTIYTPEMIKMNHFVRMDHPANILIRKIREFNQGKYNSNGLMSAPAEREQLVEWVQQIYDELETVLMGERRVKRVYSPCFVIGDIHGNLEDLLSLENTIWKTFPCTGVHYVFLGDYVDRGRWSIECALMLLSIKVLMPKSVTLLRGNHEIRDLQIKYTYRRELFQKYDKDIGQRMWDLTNNIFDRLPLCATIDDAIYCAHGGIPHQTINLNQLEESIPTVIPNPENDSQEAWEILWSDPIQPEQFNMVLNMYEFSSEDHIREGYIHNTKRGTAYYFNEKAVDNFFAENNLTNMIRAHEVPKMGFMFHFEQKCTTVFSCSHYCGNENDCGVLFVDRGKMRIIRIDTSSNLSATDVPIVTEQ